MRLLLGLWRRCIRFELRGRARMLVLLVLNMRITWRTIAECRRFVLGWVGEVIARGQLGHRHHRLVESNFVRP